MDFTIIYADPPPPADQMTGMVAAGSYNTQPAELRVTLDDGRVAVTGLSQGIFRAHQDIPDDILEQAHQQLKAVVL